MQFSGSQQFAMSPLEDTVAGTSERLIPTSIIRILSAFICG